MDGHPDTVVFVLLYCWMMDQYMLDDFVDCNGTVKYTYSSLPAAELPIAPAYNRTDIPLRLPNALSTTRFGSSEPLFVLASKDTILGREAMAYDLQALKRAKFIVGEDETMARAAAQWVEF